MVIRTAFQSTAISPEASMCEALIKVYYYEEYKCNLVKFVRMAGDHMLWRRTFEQLMIWLRPVLDGVPKEVSKKEFELSNEEEALMDKYFTSPRELRAREQAQKEAEKAMASGNDNDLMDMAVDYDDVAAA